MLTKILIIRFSSIGDIILTTPVIRCIKQQFEGETEIHYLTKKKFASILEANPYITKLHTIEDKVSEVTSSLKGVQFDYVIDLHNNIRSALVKRKLKGLSFTVNKINLRKWLMVNFKINRLPDVHIVDRYMDTLKLFSVKNDCNGLDYFIPDKEEVDLSSLPESHREGYLGFAIGAKHKTKCLPLDKIISICKKIGKPIVLLGDADDKEKAETIKGSVGNTIFNACGKYSINQSASLVRQAEKIITHDTGLMHVAAAFKKDIVSVWGNTIPEFGMYPYLTGTGVGGMGTIIEIKNLSCRPCSKLGFKKCPKKHFKCMNLIDEEEIVEAIG
ncbi:MAG: glycosyltransferase family 9 protein [Bacteroidota bacterium]